MLIRNLSALAVVVVIAGSASAQTPAAPVARFAAATANLIGGPDSVRIDVLAWSSDAARTQLVDAWNMLPPVAGAPAGGRGAAGARGARGGAAPAPEGAVTPPAAAAPPTARGGARGGRGAAPAGNPGGAVATPRDTPAKSLAAALESASGVGYLWTSESTGYSLRYAYRFAQPDGGERIILATDRRLGARDDSWKPAAGGSASEYDFSVIELRLNSKLEGEGKASMSGKVAVDSVLKTIALEDYASVPVTLKNVKSRN